MRVLRIIFQHFQANANNATQTRSKLLSSTLSLISTSQSNLFYVAEVVTAFFKNTKNNTLMFKQRLYCSSTLQF